MSGDRRDYRAEYARRIARGRSRRVPRTAARGHGRAAAWSYEPGLEEALKAIRDGESLSRAADHAHVAPERLRWYLEASGVAERRGRRWTIGRDDRVRELPIYSRGRAEVVRFRGYEQASLAGAYLEAVRRFQETNEREVLAPFAGKGLTDLTGRFHPFEVRPNELYRLTIAGLEPVDQIYRIVLV